VAVRGAGLVKMVMRAEKTFCVLEYARTVNRDGAATFLNQVRKGPAGEEQHKAMV
jgi:hypothetical protein